MVLCPSLHVTLWFPLRGLTSFSFADVLVFKPLLNYCMSLFDFPFLSGYSFEEEKRKKKRNACIELFLSTFWTLIFQFCRVRDYFWLLAEALKGHVTSLLMLSKHVKPWCCLCCWVAGQLAFDAAGWWLCDADHFWMYWPSSSWQCKQALSVAVCSHLMCALVIASLPSIIKDLKTITLWLTAV